MTTLNIALPDHLRAFVEAQVAQGGHASPDAYLLAVLEDARRRKALDALAAKIDEARAEGPTEPMTREDWDALERNIWERHHQEQAAKATPR
jgi:antitoxin ParD1/3/4